MEPKFSLVKTYDFDQRLTDMCIFVGAGLPPTHRISKLRLSTKGQYRQMLLAEYRERGHILRSVEPKRQCIEEAACNSGWEPEWDECYSKAERQAPGVKHKSDNIDDELAYYEKLRKLQVLRQQFGVPGSSPPSSQPQTPSAKAAAATADAADPPAESQSASGEVDMQAAIDEAEESAAAALAAAETPST